jgi:xanthine dehydrogenase large subunit
MRIRGLPAMTETTGEVPGRLRGGVGAAVPHDSARKHVSGEAVYTDDIPELPGTLHAVCALSDKAHAEIVSIDLAAARAAPGVRAVLTVADVPGDPDIGAVFPGDPVLADGRVQFVGQPVVAVAADTLAQARAAAALVRIEYRELPAILTAEEAFEKEHFVSPSLTMAIGDSAAALASAPRRLEGRFEIGGQDHFYLEGMIAYAQPREDGDLLVFSSTQHPSEVQHLIARALALPDNAVTVECRRMGGGFGGKETQPAQIACIAALLARATGRPVKYRLDRDDDMVMTGKRHDFHVRYRVGFDDDGRIRGIDMDLAGRCGFSPDLSNAVVDRAMFHADNGYFLGNATIRGHRCKTHTVSNTAFRGFGGPQGMAAIEYVVDAVARTLGKDPLDVRRANLYGGPGRDVTHYHMRVEDNVLPELLDALEASSSYRARRAEIDAFNRANPLRKRGLALTPVKFGISFTVTHLNQAGALVLVYQDGTVQLNHGGTEMGQGVYVKVAQIVAEELQVDLDRIRITATTTGKVPNTSPTAASSGTDLNGMAARNAAREIRNRMTLFLAEHFRARPEDVEFRDNAVLVRGERALSFPQAAKLCYLNRVQLSATGFYKTPKIWWNRPEGRGRPFYYFAYGAAATEAEIDVLTGEYRFLRADVLHDVGRSINPAVDMGQIEGGYVQGLGWLTMEELWWDAAGRLRTHAPSTYKIPTARDVPADFRVAFFERGNPEDTVHRSKAVGEPPLMLAISAWLALRDAVAAVGDHAVVPDLDAPATPERVLMACEDVKARLAARARAAAE